LINNFKLATQLGAEVIKIENKRITNAILDVVEQKNITTVCIGKPHLNLFKVILSTTIFNKLLNNLSSSNIDLVILS
jgi:two-component system sensor histidine kinase KdpD